MAGARFHSELVAALEFEHHGTGPGVLHCVAAVVWLRERQEGTTDV